MNRLIVQNKIADLLAVFSIKISILGSNNEYSWNTLAENIFIPLLNHALDCNFVNENIESLINITAIDLVDKERKVAVQITSSGNFAKIKSTVEKFFNNSLEHEFDKIYFLILKDKKGFKINSTQEEQLLDIIQDRITFNFKTDILDFGNLYTLLNKVGIDELNMLNINLEKELGVLSSQLIKNSPAVTVLFDDNEVEIAFKVIKGLLERDLRIRYFSEKLMYLMKSRGVNSEYCQRLYDTSNESSATLILSTKSYIDKIENKTLSEYELRTLRNQHLKHILIKFDQLSSLSHYDWISPIVRRGIKNDLSSTINFVSNELHKVNKVIEIQDYNDFETIIKLFDNKLTFGQTINYRNSKNKIGYQLIPANNELLKVTTNFLFIPKGCSLFENSGRN